ncbi:hypothetical protein KEM48_005288 [Puccinia striiformis f. sp. tritici PST-130]|nr:hypothetical protein KEM48_005288 [Puccinia striiformis f. sp. tritici PST-130]
MPSSKSTNYAIETFARLAYQCEDMQQHHAVVYGDEKAMSNDEMNYRIDLLTQVQTNFLPSLQQNLAHLLECIDLEGLRSDTRAKLRDNRTLASSISVNLNGLCSALGQMAPFINSVGFKYSRNDSSYGSLKQYRCDALRNKISHQLVPKELYDLFLEYTAFVRIRKFPYNREVSLADRSDVTRRGNRLIAKTAEISHTIECIVQWSRRSDYGILQEEWGIRETQLTDRLSQLINRLDAATQSYQENNIEIAVINPVRAPENNEAGNDPMEDNQDEANRPEERAAAPPPPLPLKTRIVELMQLALPVVELARNFYRRLLNDRYRREPFRLDSQMSSHEIEWLQSQLCPIGSYIIRILKILYTVYDRNIMLFEINEVHRLAFEVSSYFDSSIVLLGFHLLPPTFRRTVPSFEEFFKNSFYYCTPNSSWP